MPLYLGRRTDPTTGAPGPRLDLQSTDLLTHGLIVGMTGSGKTGLGIVLIEEALRQGIPVLAIDPKGDLGNLLLQFDRLDGASFAPWVDPEAARRDGQTVEAAAEAAAAAWRGGLAEWGLSADDVAALRRAHEALIWTPGSSAGVPLNVLQSLDPPAVPFDSAEEDLRDEIAGIVAGLLAMAGIHADPQRSREAILLQTLVEHAWRAGQACSLETLIPAIGDPPMTRLGALPVESVYPRRDREALMIALNTLLAAPSFESWREGEPLSIERLLQAGDGRPRLSIVYTAHLADEERLFVTALLLNKVKTWMRRLGGTTGVRALVYMDEIYGYFPPHPANPPTKKPLLTLLKQARAQGVSVVLATQNPVDLDYKGLANMGVWMVGRLQTAQDRERLTKGLEDASPAAGDVDQLLQATRKRVFLLHDVHRPAPVLFETRWSMSFLRGPLTREDVERLMAGRQPSAAPAAAAEAAPAPAPRPDAAVPDAAAPVAPSPAAASAARAPATAPARPAPAAPAAPPVALAAPVLPAGLDAAWLDRGGPTARPHLFVKYAVRYKDAGEVVATRAWPLWADSAGEVFEAEPLEVDEGAVADQPPRALRYDELPEWLPAAGARGLDRALRDRLPAKLTEAAWYDPVTRTRSQPREDRDAFAARLSAAGGGDKLERLRDQLERKKRDLAAREQDLSGRKTEKWVAAGSAILSNLGLFTGRKRSVSGLGSVVSKNRMENTAEARVEQLRAEIADLEKDIGSLAAVDPARLEEKVLQPTRADVTVLRSAVLWVA